MIYKSKQRVIIADSNNKLVDGEIVDVTNFGEGPLYWIKYEDGFQIEIGLFSEAQLDDYNIANMEDYCECGSVATNQPGHSYYCKVK